MSKDGLITIYCNFDPGFDIDFSWVCLRLFAVSEKETKTKLNQEITISHFICLHATIYFSGLYPQL